MLTSELGPSWRSKIPKIPSVSNLPRYELSMKPSEKTVSPLTQPSITAPVPLPEQTVPESQPCPTSEVSSEEKFNRLKAAGNQCVGNVSGCIEHSVLCFLNGPAYILKP